MKTLHYLPALIFVAAILHGCSPRQLTKAYDQVKIQRIYEESVGEAAKPQPWKISKNLIEIKKNNPQLIWKTINGEDYLLVSTWVQDTSWYKTDPNTGFYNTGTHAAWITTAPELQNRCRNQKFGRKEGLDLRMKQMLGMPPTVVKKFFVEFWVRPKDLFRPCPDQDITDNTCGLAFPGNVSAGHKKWINDLRLASYYNPTWNKNYPWTELGYTYDWYPKNKTHIGMSEFVIGENKNVIINKFYTTMEYCDGGN